MRVIFSVPVTFLLASHYLGEIIKMFHLIHHHSEKLFPNLKNLFRKIHSKNLFQILFFQKIFYKFQKVCFGNIKKKII